MADQELLAQALQQHRGGHFAEAEAIYRQLLAQNANHAEALNLLGALLHQTGRSAEGYTLLVRAAELQPDHPGIRNNVGEVARALGRLDESIAAFRRAIEIQPEYAAAHANLGLTLAETGQLDDAIASLQRAIHFQPEYAKAHTNLGMLFHALGRYPEALEACRTAVNLAPRWPEAHNNLGNVLRAMHQIDDAITEYRTAIELKPDHATAYHNMGEAIAREGDIDTAMECFRRALLIRPDYLMAHQTMLFMMHYSNRFTAAEIFAEHLKWAAQYEAPLAATIQPHTNDRSPDRRLRIGYVSPDFRRHPVGYFMRPIFAHHDPQQVEIFVYSDIFRGDAVTDFFRSRTHAWRETYGLNDEQLAEQIRADQIDILIDLTLHMAKSRLLAFARKPAPIQATYLGYAHSTGLKSMDYKITDGYLDPPGMSEAFHTEKLIRLETNFCCEPEPTAPEVGELPAKTNGYITFASSNTLMKTNAAVIETWCRILNELPNSRLLLIATGLGSGASRIRVLQRFTKRGIAPERIEIADFPGFEPGMRALERADIALDTFPYNGGTTTANALWMGLPVITLAGASPIGRQGVSFLSNLGLPELIAKTPEQYVTIAVELAKDLDRLADLRSGMRNRMRTSPLMDGPRFARVLEAAYRQMWKTWCA